MKFRSFIKRFRKKRNIGLALGGGAVYGAAHVGVLRALEEADISIRYITGTSIGAFIGALYAFGKNWQEIREIALDLDWLDISSLSLSKSGLLSNEKLGKVLDETIGDVDIEQAAIPLAMIATDISNGKKVVLNKGKVAPAVMASTCIPGVFIPIEINNTLLVDGGIVENVPVTSLKEMGAEYIIAVDLHAKLSHKRPENIVDVLLNTFDFTFMHATKFQTEEADMLITPDLSAYNLIDTDQVPELIKQGYTAAKGRLKG